MYIMSAYYPPRENVPIFDASLFSTENDAILTRQVANSSFLQFPIAQGTETLKDIIVEGTASFTNVAPPTSTATQPASNDSSTKMPTTAWVQGAITANGNNLTNIQQTLTTINIPTATSTTSLPFTQTLNIPSAGIWLILGEFSVVFAINAPNPSTTTEGWAITGFGGLTYVDWGTQTGLAIPNGLSITKNFSVSTLYTATAPVALTGTASVINSQYGTNFAGTLYAVKISS
jgi:hypothetical protein